MAVATDMAAGLGSAEEFDVALSVAFCGYNARCGSIGVSEQAACEQGAAALRAMYPPTYSLGAAVAAGRLGFDPAAAQKCVDAWKIAGCTVDQQILANRSCDGVFVPRVAPGGACQWDGECVGGWCDGSVEAGCGGACKAFVADGAACNPNDDRCIDSDFCHPGTSVCTPRVGVGAACAPTARCQRGLFCLDDPLPDGGLPDGGAAPSSCHTPGKVGEPCVVFLFGNDSCSPQLFCDDSLAEPICRARLGAGGSCASFVACQDGLDCIGLDVAPGKCAPHLDVGVACDPMLTESGCPLDQRCDDATRRCVARGRPGDDCTVDAYCRRHAWCDDSGVCAATVPFGAACTPAQNGHEPCDEGACDDIAMKCAISCL